MRNDDLRQLAEIAALIADRDLAALAALQTESRTLALKAEALGAPPAPTPANAADPATRAGAGPLWERWRIRELRRLQAERARIGAEMEVAKEAARRSFGRQVALSELSERAG